jgi:hypothetical protein
MTGIATTGREHGAIHLKPEKTGSGRGRIPQYFACDSAGGYVKMGLQVRLPVMPGACGEGSQGKDMRGQPK